MKLNYDCIRDVLLYLEDNLEYVSPETDDLEHKEISVFAISKAFAGQYAKADVQYTIEKLTEAGYITLSGVVFGKKQIICKANVSDITFTGHEFLGHIREPKVWDVLKSGAKKAGVTSIGILGTLGMALAEKLVTDDVVVQSLLHMLTKS